jgi:hypothetical protein
MDEGMGAVLLRALGFGGKGPEKPVLSQEEEAAPWLVPQGGAGAAGAGAQAPTPADVPAPPSRLDELDSLMAEIKKQKQRAAILGGSPAPQ